MKPISGNKYVEQEYYSAQFHVQGDARLHTFVRAKQLYKSVKGFVKDFYIWVERMYPERKITKPKIIFVQYVKLVSVYQLEE